MDLLLKRGLRIGAASIAALFLVMPAVRAQGDLRPSVVEVEWQTRSGYERCAAVVTARRPEGVEAWTAGHCAEHPFSVVRFFDGYVLPGSRARVLARSEAVDAARLLLMLDAGRARTVTLAARARTSPPLGTTVSVIGHPVSALNAPNQGRWTTTFARMGAPASDPATGAPEYEIYCPRCGPGDSGSGVFDADGLLLGIVYGVTEIANAAGGRLPDGLYADVVPAGALR